ncbi:MULTISPECIES: type II secretion system protein [unclassified Nitratiruptor]|uniref:type II secretion system protein n=1 Tax=unclassified Nitratiruptor TaxID=2624044 RepID=UPI0019155E84|nr:MULTISPECIES: type II secretion system protein [unclassified Nitratiruptor]
MRRGGFTMIELIFVIVILGILAAVALPKFVGVSEQAREGKLKAFVGTLNRTVGPAVWSKAIANDGSGKIAKLTLSDGEKNLSAYVDIPQEIDASTVDLSKCNDNTQFKTIAETDDNVMPGDYTITCRDGNSTNAPAFQLVDSSGKVLAGPSS